jgi:hypothetical protein
MGRSPPWKANSLPPSQEIHSRPRTQISLQDVNQVRDFVSHLILFIFYGKGF